MGKKGEGRRGWNAEEEDARWKEVNVNGGMQKRRSRWRAGGLATCSSNNTINRNSRRQQLTSDRQDLMLCKARKAKRQFTFFPLNVKL